MQKQPREVFYKKAVLENFAILTGKHLCWSFFLILNIAQFLKAPIFKTSTNGCFWKCVHERRKLYIKKRIFQHQYQKPVKMYMFGYFMVISFEFRLDLHAMFFFDIVNKCLLEKM